MKKLIVLLMLLVAAPAFAGDFTVIANKSVSDSAVSAKELKNIFLGKKTSWSDGSDLVAVTQEGPAHAGFIKTATKKNAQQFEMFWKKAVFTGTGTPPAKVADDAEILSKVASTPGAIGYVTGGAETTDVKVINTN